MSRMFLLRVSKKKLNFFLRLLKPESFSPILALIGVILLMTTKNNYSRRKPVGGFLIGFAILMFGMGLMSSSMAPLAHDPNFANILIRFYKKSFRKWREVNSQLSPAFLFPHVTDCLYSHIIHLLISVIKHFSILLRKFKNKFI